MFALQHILASFLIATITPTMAVYTTGKAVQINYYTDTKCTAYHHETEFWHDKYPRAGTEHVYYYQVQQGDCFDIPTVGAANSLNVADGWEYSGAEIPSRCTFWDAENCQGNSAKSGWKSPWGDAGCLAGRSPAGRQWKSARCYKIYTWLGY
ncbi:hypothetical protein GGR58DRAFT_509370 [Xylaria digitata]|nr:hypothetical protein GGR58DRAFT_509370 [Xylaria digitata]